VNPCQCLRQCQHGACWGRRLVTRTDCGNEDGAGEQELREAAPDVPPRLVPGAVVGIVVIGVGQVTGQDDDVGLIGLQ